LAETLQLADGCIQALSDRHAELELFSRRSANLSHRLYSEALASRMRPFADGIQAFPRLVRDLARTLGKEIKLEIVGENTPVDRDVLERLEAPLNHLLRNAVDHGMELPEERRLAGKPDEGTLRMEARHVSGQLQIVVEDDGKGIPLTALRDSVVRKKLTTKEVADQLSEDELLDFLFLPGFSMRESVTEISGRGVGLDAVQTMVKSVGGSVRATTVEGKGTRFQIQLPLTLSVIRALLVEIGGEPYAFPLVRTRSAIQVPRERIETLEGKEHAPFGNQQIGLVSGSQLFGQASPAPQDILPVVVLGDRGRCFGVAVDRFLGERELVVQPLDHRLGKIKDISAGALMPDGSPVLIIDADDLLRSIETLISGGGINKLRTQSTTRGTRRRKRVLVVDDSLTVRELERKLLSDAGYEVEAAVDGMDGWNAVRTQSYDLVVTDIDMPRLDGIELVRLIKNEARVKSIPVMIVSYKDRPEDRHRGLEAGADYYLTKGSFHDETLLHAVADLIGKADEDELSN
jgi:two-component system sensor histidine kinase and response regulator WspE